MENNDKIKKTIIECIALVFIMVLYIAYGIYYIPMLMIIIPLPFIIIGVRNGMKASIISMAVTSLIIGMLLGFESTLSIILLFVPLSLALNYSIKTRKTTQETILISTMVFFLSFVMIISFEKVSSNFDIIKQSEQEFSKAITMQVEMLKESGMSDYEIVQRTDLLETIYKQTVVLMPSLLGIFSLFVSYINFFLSSIFLRKMGYVSIKKQNFSKFKLPSNIILGVGVMFITAFIIQKLKIQYHEELFLNISFLVGFIFVLQGFSVFDFLLIKIKMKLIPRIIVLTINVIMIPMGGIMFFVGMLDAIFDFRKKRIKKSL